MATSAYEWQDWVESRGGAVLDISTPELLPPGLREALGFDRYEVIFREGLNARSVALVHGDGDVEVRLSASLLAPKAKEGGTIERRIRTNREAVHEKFWLPQLDWGRGNARAMLSWCVPLYQELGIESISLEAFSVGRYVWGVAGFDFADEQTREAVNVGARVFANKAGIRDDLPDFQHPWDLLALDVDDDGNEVLVPEDRLADALANQPEAPKRLHGGSGLAPSKALLLYGLHDAWDGVFDLTANSDSLSQLQLFLGDYHR